MSFPFLKTLEISHSSRCAFRSCPRKFEFRKIYNNSRRSEGLATGAGKAMHAGVQEYLTNYDEEAAIWAMMREYPIKYQKSFAAERSIDASYISLMHAIHWEKLQEFELAQIVVGEHAVSMPATEVPFILRIKNFPFYPNGQTVTVDYVGFIDLILFNKIENKYLNWDIKTTTKDIDQSVLFQFDEQCLPYGLVLEALLGNNISLGYDVAYWSILINHLEPKNKLYSYNKTQADIQDWIRGYLSDLNLIKQYYNDNWFPRHGNACMGFNRPCANFDFCASRDSKVIEVMLQQDAANQTPKREIKPWVVVELEVAL